MNTNTDTTQKVNLRDLDDISCANVVMSRQIRHLVRKSPSLGDISIDCWVHDGHYTRFKCHGEELSWYCEDGEPCKEDLKKIGSNTDCFYKDEWNKLLAFTFQTMCESLNGLCVEDTPADLLSIAESKLQQLLHDSDSD